MMDKELLAARLAELPLYTFEFVDPAKLEFNERIRWICQHECPMYGQSWACPPAVGTVAECEGKCRRFTGCLMISTITEVEDIANIEETLATRPEHEAITNQVRDLMRELGTEPYVLSTEACAECERCAYLYGEACRFPDRMHPCVESHGINLLAVLDELGLSFQYGENVVTWFSLLFFNE